MKKKKWVILKQNMIRGAIQGLTFLTVSSVGFAGILMADSLNVFSSGETISSSQMNANFQKISPIGSIVAWHGSFSPSLSLPDGWVQCDGQTINDSESILDGLVLPDLNGQKNAWNTNGSFLRGSSTSGAFEDDQFQGHRHPYTSRGGGTANTLGGGNTWNATTTSTSSDPSAGAHGSPRFGGETRPVNMAVIWIIRIK